MIDSTIVRARQRAAGATTWGNQTQEAIGRSKGGLTTRIHATCDALGNPTGFHLTPGQAPDLDGADVLLPGIDTNTIIADTAFDTNERVIEPLRNAGQTIVIPPKSNRKVKRAYDKDLYKARHLIENSFPKLKQFRTIATRYDRRGQLPQCYLSRRLNHLGLIDDTSYIMTGSLIGIDHESYLNREGGNDLWSGSFSVGLPRGI